jgi:hypothetical protein
LRVLDFSLHQRPGEEELCVTLGIRAAVFVFVGVAVVAGRLSGAQQGTRYTATVVNEPGRGTSTLQIVVDRWSTDMERDRLVTTLFEEGPDRVLEVLKDMPPVGYIRNPASTGWELRFARSTPLPDGGEQVVLATDRPISFWESSNQPRTIEYPFTVIELRLDAQGEGEGKLSAATKILADKQSGTIVLENYAMQKTLLQRVRREKST